MNHVPGVGEALVVEIDRVLGREDHAHAERPRLLQQRQQRQLRRRVRDRREVAEDLVHVDDRAQAGGARTALRIQPSISFSSSETKNIRSASREVGDREDREPRLALRRVEQRADVERLALEPGVESGRGQEVVEPRSPARTRSFAGKNESRSSTPTLATGGVLDLLDERRQVEVPPVAPRGLEELREQDVLAALHRVGLDAEEPEQARRGGPDPLAEELRVVARRAGAGAANDLRIDTGSPPCCRACRLRSRRRRAGRGSARRPGPRLPSPSARARPAGAAYSSGVTPLRRASSSLIHGREVLRAEIREGQQRFARSPLGSMISAGMPSRGASSSSPRQSPVLPLPVMPTHTAWVTRSLES